MATASNPITVLLADDHLLVRQCVHALLALDRGIRVVGEACTGLEAVKLARKLRPDVIVMDMNMPVLNGLEATRRIVAADGAPKVLALSANGDDVSVDGMCRAGASGFVEKQSSIGILAKAIREIAMGRPFFSSTIAKRLADRGRGMRDRAGPVKAGRAALTPREIAVLRLVAESAANKEIARGLGISIKTVEKHRQGVMNKLAIHDTAGLTRHAVAAGIAKSGAGV